MSKRGRGRPPKNPLLHALSKQRKIAQENSQSLSMLHSKIPTQIQPLNLIGSGGLKQPRESAQRSRLLLAEVMSHTKTESKETHESDNEPGFLDTNNESDIESKCDLAGNSDNDSTYSESSYSTISSTPSRKRLCIGLQTQSNLPLLMNQCNVPLLELPQTSTDILLPLNCIMQAIGIYEVLRHFRHQLRLTPFCFEDFSAALLSSEQCSLMAEIHIALLKSLIREDDLNNTTFGPQDVTHFVNIQLYLIDGITWPEVLRVYVESDPEFYYILPLVEKGSYPYGSIEDKLKVLQFLTDQFLSTNATREKLLSEGAITYDDHCRSCHRLGDLICCDTCSAVYHLECINPPLNEVPVDDWVCDVCRNNKVEGVTDCISEFEKTGLMVRDEPIGFDRHLRKYWFLVRRIIVESEDRIWYYSSELQIKELIKCLDDRYHEQDLCRTLKDLMSDVLHQSKITEDLTNRAKGNLKSVIEFSNQTILTMSDETAACELVKEDPKSIELVKEIKNVNFDEDLYLKKEQEIKPFETITVEKKINEPKDIHIIDNDNHVSNPHFQHLSANNNINPNQDLYHLPKILTTENDSEDRILTRSRNPSYKPPPPKESPYISYSTGPLTPSLSKIQSITTKGNINESFSVLNEKGEYIPIFSVKNKDGFMTINIDSAKILQENNIFFKLGMEGSFKQYKNQYSINNLALNKPQHSEDSNKKRYLSHKFSLGQGNEFKWFGTLFGGESLIILNIRSTLTELEKNIPDVFLHSNWKWHRMGWIKAVNMCSKPSEFALALAILESAIRSVVFNSIWHEGLGHWKLDRQNPFQRDEKKKLDKKRKEAEDDDLERQKLTCSWVKYTILNVRHTVWKSKGEEYRIYGGGGFFWISKFFKTNAKKKQCETEDFPSRVDSKEQDLKKNYDNDFTKQKSLTKNDIDNKKSNLNLDSFEGIQVPIKELTATNSEQFDKELVCNKIENTEDSEPDDIDGVLNVGKAIRKHSLYRKVTRYSSLNHLLDRRLLQEANLQEEYITKRKKYESYLTVGQQLLDKKKETIKISDGGIVAKRKSPQLFQCELNEENNIIISDSHNETRLVENKIVTSKESFQMKKSLGFDLPQSLYPCYSPLCNQLGVNIITIHHCYSTICQTIKSTSSSFDNPILVHSFLPTQNISTTISSLNFPTSKNISHMTSENTHLLTKSTFSTSTHLPTDVNESPKGKLIDKSHSNILPITDPFKKDSKSSNKNLMSVGLNSGELKIINTSKSILLSPTNSFVKSNTIQDRLYSPKVPPRLKNTCDSLYLSKENSSKGFLKKNSRQLPTCVKFVARNGKKSLFILQKNELKKIARKGGIYEVTGFNYNAKTTGAVGWPYQSTPRPRFKTVWRYNVQILKSLSAVSLLLRVLWVCIRWEDIAVKPPTDSNIEETADELITKAILKRRDTNGDGLLAEYLVRKVITPIDEEEEREELYIPQRKGLRSSTRTPKPKSMPKPKGPQIIEEWVNEDQLELWEIKQFGERIEQQQEQTHQQNQQNHLQKHGILQHSLKDRSNIPFSSLSLASTIPAGATVSANQSAQQIKEQLEMQLKLQRQAMQQKRLQSTTLCVPTNLQKSTSQSSTETAADPLPLSLHTPSPISTPTTISNTLKVSKANPVSILPARTFPSYIIQSGKSVTTVPTGTNIVTTKITLSPQILKPQSKVGNTNNITTHQPILLQAVRDPLFQTGSIYNHKVSPIQLQLRGATPVQLRGHLVRNADGTQRVIITPTVITSPGIQQEPNKEVKYLPQHQISQFVSNSLQKSPPPVNFGVIKEDLDQERLLTCAKVLTTILDRIEKEDRQVLKKKKQLNMRLSSKLSSVLIKHKENLKKMMIKKKELLEKEFLQELQEEVSHEISKQISSIKKKRKLDLHMHKVVEKNLSKPKKLKLANQETNHLYCICKKPYDPTKFYIGCELCNNWFHGSCVNILEENANKLTEYICSDCESQKYNKDQDLFCICQTPYDESQFYIGCDNCQDWFHGKCVAISPMEAEKIKKYLCPQCKTFQSDNISSKKIFNSQDYENLFKILKQLQNHTMAWPFQRPVNEIDAHDYYKIIKEPMDLSTVEKKIKMKNYSELQQFIGDITKMFDNCRYYNSTESSFYHCADVLEKYFIQKYKSFKWK